MAGPGEMVMKLLLNTKEFDKNLKKTNKELYDFGKNGAKSIDDFIGKIGKIAGVAGVAMGGFELIQKGINSCQAGTDAWGRTMESVKAVTDELIYSISTLDTSSLFNGFENLINRAEELYDAFDKLANVQMSASFGNTLDQAEFKRLMVTARNKQLTPEERQAALEQAKIIAARIDETSKILAEASMDAVIKSFAKEANVDASIFNPKMIEEAFRLDARLFSEEERAKAVAEYKAYKEELKKINQKYHDEGFATENGIFITKDNSAIRAELGRAASEKYAEAITKYIALQKLADEKLKGLMDTYVSAVQSMNMASESMGQTNEVQATMTAEFTAQAKKNSQEAEKAAKKAHAEAQKAAEEAAKLQASYEKVMSRVGAPTRAEFTGVSGLDGATIYSGLTRPKTEKKKDPWDPTADLPDTIEGLKDIEMPNDFKRSKLEENAEGVVLMTSAIAELSNAFAVLGGEESSAAAKILVFADATATAIGKIVEFISFIVAETAARRANANAAMTEMGAKQASANAKAGVAGVALAAAAIGASVAAVKSIPKLAEGGIATRATLGIFGEAGPEAILPLDKLKDFVSDRDIKVSGEIRGQGKDLVVIIDSYNKVRNVKQSSKAVWG